MKNAAVVVCACACVLGAEASARTLVIPHVFETSGNIQRGPSVSPFNLSQVSNLITIEEIGPGENSEFNYLYSAPFSFSTTDSLGRPLSLRCEVLFAQTRPEGGGFRSDLIMSVDWTHFEGAPVDAAATAFELSVFGFEPQPLSAGGLAFSTPSHTFGTEIDGRTVNMNLAAGTFRLQAVPSPAGVALLVGGGLVVARRRR
ncbi:MAG TPA: hypothetical protein VD997_16580 [Phycisphaerales bacterium]|nr:hypothetical protein [Phycisphaerales bacterium]